MSAPLLARFALDAQESFMAAAGGVPPVFRDEAPPGLMAGAWLVTHAAASHQLWIGSYIGGRPRDPWYDAFRDDLEHFSGFADSVASLGRVIQESTEVLVALSESSLTAPGRALPTSRFSGWTVGQLIARAIAHMYAHAADLNTLAVIAGAEDIGLPGFMPNVRLAP